MVKQIDKRKVKTRELMLAYPTYTDEQLADRVGVAPPTIKNYKKEIASEVNRELANSIATKFIDFYSYSSEKLMQNITALEEQKSVVEQILRDGYVMEADKDGNPVKRYVRMSDAMALRKEIREMIAQQTNILKVQVNMVQQSQAVTVMKMVQDRTMEID